MAQPALRPVLLLAALLALGEGIPEPENMLPGCPDIVPRSEWRALPSRCLQPLSLPLEYVVVSHTAGQPCFSPQECEQQMRNIQNYHMQTLGWCDIAYKSRARPPCPAGRSEPPPLRPDAQRLPAPVYDQRAPGRAAHGLPWGQALQQAAGLAPLPRVRGHGSSLPPPHPRIKLLRLWQLGGSVIWALMLGALEEPHFPNLVGSLLDVLPNGHCVRGISRPILLSLLTWETRPQSQRQPGSPPWALLFPPTQSPGLRAQQLRRGGDRGRETDQPLYLHALPPSPCASQTHTHTQTHGRLLALTPWHQG
ncbi:peptidoglycan recognition protein 1 isoform 1-T1 [Sarcophilus harrisii]